LNENAIPMAFFFIIFALNIQYPIVGILFIVVPLLITVVRYGKSLRHSKSVCAECVLYHNEKEICLYKDECVERCDKFKPNTKGDE